MATNKRMKYKTPVEYPQTFTLRELYEKNHHKIKMITLYVRVQNKIENGEIERVSLRDSGDKRRGRKEVVYSCVPSDPVVATADVATPSTINW